MSVGYGDEILAAGQAERAHAQDPSRKVAILGVDGQPRWHPIWDGNPIIATPGEVQQNVPTQVIQSGPNCRPYIQYPFTPDTGWTFNRNFRARDHIAKLYLTEQERAIGEHTRSQVGPYVLIEPYTKHDNLRWPLERWQQVVNTCDDLTFVQHVHADSPTLSGVHRVPARFREACGLIAHSRLYVRSESGLCHAAAALDQPMVTIWGGCMDWDVLGGYPKQLGLVDKAPGSPCGSWKPCPHCVAAMNRITVANVIAAMRTALEWWP